MTPAHRTPTRRGERGGSPFGLHRPGIRRSQIIFDTLDGLSRRRALSDAESEELQNAMRTLGMI